ncbi:MAG: sulfotransferase [gamma proteobacterium symbiont of Taylorina sp.]|nr:sulfotransferase [gamma proteobacterium symbiont of Taylorina sp.]
MKSPIFIFSLPRSGSTLLQKILMSHKKIASVAESWFLLPLLYANKIEGILSEFSQETSCMAIEDFINNLPHKENDYINALKVFSATLYEKQCLNNEVYFLDKTPRYYLIIPEIINIFPDAKFIFLFRNPIHVYSSVLSTWGNNRFNLLYENYIDIYEGPSLLSESFQKYKEQSHAIQYEALLEEPEKIIIKLFNYLELDYDPNVLKSFAKQETKGRMGDPNGVLEYKSIDKNPLEKWKKIFNTPFRKRIITKYIDGFDEHSLLIQGYDKKYLLQEIKKNVVLERNKLIDRFDYFFSYVIQKINIKNHKKLIIKLECLYNSFIGNKNNININEK